jgi:Zn-dependent alcohol dehydrogenase
MRAAVTVPGTTELEVVDVEIADPAPGQVRVRVHHCSVCHSDHGTLHLGLDEPTILGHEAAGVVDAVGEGVTSVVPGDTVVVSPATPCGRCYFCVRDEPTLCAASLSEYGGTFADGTTGLARGGTRVMRGLGVGGFAEHLLVREHGAVKIPADVPLDVACVVGCAVQTGVGAVLNTAGMEAGATVLVLGIGGVGLSAVQGARAGGASRIIAVDVLESRRDAARRMGATDVIDPTRDDVVGATRELTGVGADYAFDTAGATQLAEIGLAATRPGGTTVLVGVPPADQKLALRPLPFILGGKRLLGCTLGSCNSQRDIPRFVAMWQAGQLALDALVTHHRPIDEINEAFADLEAGVGIRTALSLVG